MKRVLGILVLGLLLSVNAYSAEKKASFKCDGLGKDDNIKGLNFSINLNNYTMDWGPVYKIIEINDEKIVGYSDGTKEGDNHRRELTFDRYTGELFFIYMGVKPLIMRLKCKKVDKTKKLF